MQYLRNWQRLPRWPHYRRKYDASLRSYRDTLAVMEGQYLDGRAEGIAETARKMKADGIPTGTIAKYTGLTPEEIEAL